MPAIKVNVTCNTGTPVGSVRAARGADVNFFIVDNNEVTVKFAAGDSPFSDCGDSIAVRDQNGTDCTVSATARLGKHDFTASGASGGSRTGDIDVSEGK